ncbi:hypothetical protein AVDCRST_MAG94-1715 [uncultured Leptolyngbya sp.]|uniref:Uncharacterized protein n=1 Tax=uncultured Leptolyngbya sp. TaxID=332963 RepID=A0A6J4LAE2_9CYAN|nr:hypothetical protein AVDCRST_MAG94-1715 [uncultured Leptolyngbya sp.]
MIKSTNAPANLVIKQPAFLGTPNVGLWFDCCRKKLQM